MNVKSCQIPGRSPSSPSGPDFHVRFRAGQQLSIRCLLACSCLEACMLQNTMMQRSQTNAYACPTSEPSDSLMSSTPQGGSDYSGGERLRCHSWCTCDCAAPQHIRGLRGLGGREHAQPGTQHSSTGLQEEICGFARQQATLHIHCANPARSPSIHTHSMNHPSKQASQQASQQASNASANPSIYNMLVLRQQL